VQERFERDGLVAGRERLTGRLQGLSALAWAQAQPRQRTTCDFVERVCRRLARRGRALRRIGSALT
jgi:hypothetical protein